jgi:hypothetical protein
MKKQNEKNIFVKDTKEYFVTYDIARLLRGLGFDYPCIARFSFKQFQMNSLGNWYDHNSGIIHIHYTSAPLWQQAIDFMEEKYNIHISLFPSYSSSKYKENGNGITGYFAKTFDWKNGESENFKYDSKKKAMEGIIYKAIEIAQSQELEKETLKTLSILKKS